MIVTCLTCGVEVIKKSKANLTQKYCSRNCYLVVWRQENREKLKGYSNDYLHAHQQSHTESNKSWRQRNPRKATVQTLTARAIKNGKITRQSCEKCGALAHAHHPDYSKHYSFIKWLCPIHHKQEHMELNHV